MAVERIEEYEDILKVILKPTKKFPNGYFYTDNNPVARELIERYCWFLAKHGKNIRVIAHADSELLGQKTLYFYQEYAYRLLNYYPDYIDHINRVEIDNRNTNLNVVTNQQNQRNRPSVGYKLSNKNCFLSCYKLEGKMIYRGNYRTEPEVLLATYHLRQQVYADYNYNFFLDRRNDLDILDLELTKKITSEKAIYLHVKRYVQDNAWYAYRYNLFDYCKSNNIKIPNFELDSQGFMISPVTKERLCPY